MNSKLIAIFLSLAVVSWTGPPAFARGHGGHGGGGGGSAVASGGGRGSSGGGHAYAGSGGGYRGGYSGGYRGGYSTGAYRGGHFRGNYGYRGNFYGSRSGISRTSPYYNRGYYSHNRGYYSRDAIGGEAYRPNISTATRGRHFTTSPRSTDRYAGRVQGGLNRTDRNASVNRTVNPRKAEAFGGSRAGSHRDKTITTRDGRAHAGNWARHDSANRNRFDHGTQDRLRNWHGRKANADEARHNHNDHHGHHHDQDWWHNRCDAIILVNWGYWGWFGGWWYPAWGYDPYYSYYAYDGPIYGYSGLPPDEVVANVQGELQRLGYYIYAVDGVLGDATQEALSRYQQEQGLPVTGTIDPATISSLGLES